MEVRLILYIQLRAISLAVNMQIRKDPLLKEV